MAFKKLQDLDCDVVIRLGGVDKETKKKNPTQLEGYYVGSRKVDSTRSKKGFTYIHVFQTSKGVLGVWGKTNMDSKVLAVKPGTMTRITFAGMVPTPNGDMYKYTVEIDEENSIEVATSPEAATEEASSETGEGRPGEEEAGGEEVEESEPDEEEPQDQPPLQRATPPKTKASTPSADRQARVKALLGGGKVA